MCQSVIRGKGRFLNLCTFVNIFFVKIKQKLIGKNTTRFKKQLAAIFRTRSHQCLCWRNGGIGKKYFAIHRRSRIWDGCKNGHPFFHRRIWNFESCC